MDGCTLSPLFFFLVQHDSHCDLRTRRARCCGALDLVGEAVLIYDLRGVPIDKEYWLDVTMAMTQLRARNAARTKRQYMGELDGSRKQIVTEDRLGDPIAIYRDITAHVRKLSPHREQYADMQKVRAAHGVGRPPRTRLYPPSQGAYYGIGPGVAALPLMRRLNRLPPAERAAAAARFVESRLGA